MLELFKKLVEIPGGSGFEEEIIETMRSELQKRVDRVLIDPMGNVIGTLGSGSRSVMIGVHTDEIGLRGTHHERTMTYQNRIP